MDNVFDLEYVSRSETDANTVEVSKLKEFLKEPVPEEEFVKYGTSKPTRIVISAKISNG